jgi:rhodanese-related sulfurtransferase
MHKRRFLVLTASLVFGSLISGSLAFAADAENFPHRKFYPELAPKLIEINDLSKSINNYIIVDVRSPFEYSVMHIQGAINIPVDDSKFLARSQQTYAEGGKPLLFYCNGRTCEKTYVAGNKALKGGFTNFMAYDGGIGEWAKINPQQTILLDKPLNPSALISPDKLEAHSLPYIDFMKRANAQPTASIIDIRSASETDGISLFPGRDIRTGFDLKKLRKAITAAKEANQTVFAYDNSGFQVMALQYLFEEMELKDYYLMKGGMVGYYKALNGK